MNNLKYDSIVSKTEAEALKDMIFKRSRERAEALNKDIENSYTNSIQNEVMDIARISFQSEKNPFSIKNEPAKVEKETEVNEISAKDKILEYSKKEVETLKARIYQTNKTVNTDLTNSELELNMKDARNNFTQKRSFMGALNFLNTQATINLISKKDNKFEALA